jgi:hypothetical protein
MPFLTFTNGTLGGGMQPETATWRLAFGVLPLVLMRLYHWGLERPPTPFLSERAFIHFSASAVFRNSIKNIFSRPTIGRLHHARVKSSVLGREKIFFMEFRNTAEAEKCMKALSLKKGVGGLSKPQWYRRINTRGSTPNARRHVAVSGCMPPPSVPFVNVRKGIVTC